MPTSSGVTPVMARAAQERLGGLGAEAAAGHVGVELGEVGDADPRALGRSSWRSVLPSASTAAFDAL